MGIVYVLTNPSMEGLVKIGRTTRYNLQNRMSELYSTGVPFPFTCEIAIEVEDDAAVERALHQVLGKMRVNRQREFFEADPDSLKPLFAELGREISIGDGSSVIDPESREDAERFAENKRASAAHLVFLERLTKKLERDHNIRKLKGRRTDHHWDFRSGFDRIWYNVGFHHDKLQVRVRLSIYRSDREFNRRLYDKLWERRREIETALGVKLDGERVTPRRESMITTYAPGSLDDTEEKLVDVRNWLVATTVKFNDVFEPHLTKLIDEVEQEINA